MSGVTRPVSFVLVLDGCVRVLVVGGEVVKVERPGEQPRGVGFHIDAPRWLRMGVARLTRPR